MKRVTLFCGHYGSGKTNIAVNYALRLKKEMKGKRVCIADIDIVNPYFRSADSRDYLEREGVEVIALPFANTNVDLPALPSEIYGLVQRRDVYAVLDIGGDDRGALALGRFTPYILEENDYEMLMTVNFYRPLTQTVSDTVEVMREIENAAGIRFTGIVNNSNLGAETNAGVVLEKIPLANELSRVTGLPVVFTAIEERLAGEVEIENSFALKLQKKIY